MEVSERDILDGLESLGIKDKFVGVHSSLSSFGYVVGGPQSVINALLKICRAILVPTFSGIGRTVPPPDDRPSRNATNYEEWLAAVGDRKVLPFDPDSFDQDSEIDQEEMGIIPTHFLKHPGSLRSKHPSVSWGANGEDAEHFLYPHSSDDPNAPLKRLLEKDGEIVLLGVSLAKCTAVHLAEELAGRRPFIRWTLYKDGIVRRMREYGCSDGFTALEPHVKHLARIVQIGGCKVVVYPIREFVEVCSLKIKESPSITVCSETCGRCLDAVKGGPE